MYSVFQEKDLDRVILLDDSKRNFETAPNNGIECLRWMGNLETEPASPPFLISLLEVIEELITIKDVRTAAKRLEEELKEKVDSSARMKPPPRKSLVLTMASSLLKGLAA